MEYVNHVDVSVRVEVCGVRVERESMRNILNSLVLDEFGAYHNISFAFIISWCSLFFVYLTS